MVDLGKEYQALNFMERADKKLYPSCCESLF